MDESRQIDRPGDVVLDIKVGQLPTIETKMITTPIKRDPYNGFMVVHVLKVSAWVVFVLMSVLFFNRAIIMLKNPSGNCKMPEYPENGEYRNAPAAKPGESFESLNLTVICLQGYEVFGPEIVSCSNGTWSDSIPKCIRSCKLNNDTSVSYRCLVSGSTEDYRACNAYEPEGTVVWPKCNSPSYYSADPLHYMTCIDGSWDRVVVCSPVCGQVAVEGVTLISDDRTAKQGEVPWHVGIYSKSAKPYMHICGGSIISDKLVLSAAHCFWSDATKQKPASEFAVAAGKIYRPWNNPRDMNAQKSNVSEIKIPDHFQGGFVNFQADIAVIILETEFVYNSFVRPICLDFDVDFDTRQLEARKLGQVAGWGNCTAEQNTQILKAVVIPYVDTKECMAESPYTFQPSVTSDKFCAGTGIGNALCDGYSGGGLAFLEYSIERGEYRYYIRGIVSTAPPLDNGDLSNRKTYTTFTHILNHERFLKNDL